MTQGQSFSHEEKLSSKVIHAPTHDRIALSNVAVKKLKRLFYNSFKDNAKSKQHDSSDDTQDEHDDHDHVETIQINHADRFDHLLAEKWRQLVSKDDSAMGDIIQFYGQTFGFPKSTRIDPLEVYKITEQEMIDERKEELRSVYELVKETTSTFIIVSDLGYKIQTMIRIPPTFVGIKADEGDLAEVSIEINLRIWDKCRYPYESPLFYVASNELQSVQLLNLSFGLQEAADLEWYGAPMIEQVLDWVNGKAAHMRLGDTPSNYALPAAYNLLEMMKTDSNDVDRSLDISSCSSLVKQFDKVLSRQLYDKFLQKTQTKSYKQISECVGTLPVYKIRQSVIENINDHSLVIITGETGCGKSTQIPKFILEHFIFSKQGNLCNILVTQPRRIAAIGLAQRASYELCEPLGSSVGYAVRLDSKYSPSTQLLYCTTGVLLKKLENHQDQPSLLLNEYSHIIIDEVHERSVDIDFILLTLKYLLSVRTNLKVILMSATANASLLAQYFGGNPPIVHIPGRTYLVETLHLEDILHLVPYSPKGKYRSPNAKNRVPYVERGDIDDDSMAIDQLKLLYPGKSEAVLQSLRKIDQEVIQYPLIKSTILFCIRYFQGLESFETDSKQAEHGPSFSQYRCILVFLPGIQEIIDLRTLLLADEIIKKFTKDGKCCLALHSSVSTGDQRRVFEPPGNGLVKIILATNIAETSLTIPDVCIVIDCGKMKETRFDSSKGIASLEECWISQANSLQRAGRAGRVCPGKCLRMYSSRKSERLQNEQTPEIHRTPLEQLLIRIKMLPNWWSTSLLEVVKCLIDAPAINSVRMAIRSLQSLKALTLEEELTPLGMHLGKLPLDIRIGKLLIYGCVFEVLEPTLTIAAIMTCKSPFLLSLDMKQNDSRKMDFYGGDSDHLTLLNMYDQWMLARKGDFAYQKSFLSENHLSRAVLEMITATRRQLLDHLIESKFVKSEKKDAAADVYDTLMLKAMLVAALYPNVIQSIPDNAERPKKYQLKSIVGEEIKIHPCSVFRNTSKFWPPFILYLEKVKTNHIYIRDVTLLEPILLILFGGDVFADGKKMLMENGWIRIICPDAQLLLYLKKELDNLISQKLENPILNLNKNRYFKAIKNIISSNGQKA